MKTIRLILQRIQEIFRLIGRFLRILRSIRKNSKVEIKSEDEKKEEALGGQSDERRS